MKILKKTALFIFIAFNILSISRCEGIRKDSIAESLKKGASAKDWKYNVGDIKQSSFNLSNSIKTSGVEWKYNKKFGFNGIYMLFKPNELKGASQVSFWLKSTVSGKFAVTLTETDNSNYQSFIDVSKGKWKNIIIPFSQFVFDKDTNDENEHLDPWQIFRLALVDIGGITSFFESGKTVSISEVEFDISSSPGKPANPPKRKGGDDTIAELYTMRTDGTGIKRLTFNKYYENHAHISPDGKKFVFTVFTNDTNGNGLVGEDDMESSEVGVMDIDGGNYKLLTRNNSADFGAVWSPDGSRILFTTSRFDGQFDLATIKSDGSGFKRLTSTKQIHEMDPHWGNNNVIVFNRWFPGKIPVACIWKMDSNGKNEVQLTKPNFPKKSYGAPFGDMDPKVSPDGRMIAFERHQNNKGNFGFGNYDLYVMNIDGSNVKNISRNNAAEAVPTWSLNGKELAFWAISEKAEDALDIFITNIDGTKRRKVTREPDLLEEEMPSWISKDMLIFSGKKSGK